MGVRGGWGGSDAARCLFSPFSCGSLTLQPPRWGSWEEEAGAVGGAEAQDCWGRKGSRAVVSKNRKPNLKTQISTTSQSGRCPREVRWPVACIQATSFQSIGQHSYPHLAVTVCPPPPAPWENTQGEALGAWLGFEFSDKAARKERSVGSSGKVGGRPQAGGRLRHGAPAPSHVAPGPPHSRGLASGTSLTPTAQERPGLRSPSGCPSPCGPTRGPPLGP